MAAVGGRDELLIAADELDPADLLELFNAGYSDYVVPLRFSEAVFQEHVVSHGIDLSCSRVLILGRPVAFALIARRGAEGWVGGMGTVPAERRRGLGERVLAAGIEAAAAAGCQALWLEVIDSNQPAIGLYEKLGFEIVRDVLVWSLAPTAASLSALVVERGAEVAAAAIYRENGERVSVLQVTALDQGSAADVLLAAAGAERSSASRTLRSMNPRHARSTRSGPSMSRGSTRCCSGSERGLSNDQQLRPPAGRDLSPRELPFAR
jgi:ribosomal protein S18 acetylase RimI-like enzyme